MGVSRNWVMFLRGLFLLLLISRSSGAEVITVDVRAAKNLLESGYGYLDVRTAEEFKEGHVDAAKIFNIPYMFNTPEGRVKNPDFLKKVRSLCKEEDRLVVGCQSGARSLHATADLLGAGFKHVSNFGGGHMAWVQNGLKKLKFSLSFGGEMKKETVREGASLADTPTWAVATVITVMIIFGFFVHTCLKHFGKWLEKTKRKSLLAALEKIKDEMMLFGVLSLLMGHWIVFVAKICVKSSALSSRFYPCASKADLTSVAHTLVSRSNFLNSSLDREQVQTRHGSSYYCPEGQESFASHESLEQLHRFIFVLGVTHVSYSFVAIALAMIKIYSWRTWENQAITMAIQIEQESSEAASSNRKMKRLSTFIFHRTSHPWSQHKVLVWLLCFSRQFWSSINRADYMALRLGFITTHQLPLTYDFHKYMHRSMEEEFRDIVGISVPLWIYAIGCTLLNFHGTNTYLWLSFIPAILILLIGTKLHRVVVKLAVEIMDKCPWDGYHQFNLRDDLFWFGKPKLLLHLIQLISFQNALEMATFLWSLWEIKEPSCFMENRSFVVIRLTFGTVTQCWCSFITFPLYVIITQMGSRWKRSVVSENVRVSLGNWKKRVRANQSASVGLVSAASNSSSDSLVDNMNKMDDFTSGAGSISMEGSCSMVKDPSILNQDTSAPEHSLHSNHSCDTDLGDHDDLIDVE